MSDVEAYEGLAVLAALNEKYARYAQVRRDRVLSAHIDRGTSVTNTLKSILGPCCQICGILGFETKNGSRYIEAHHLVPVSKNQENSLCSDNIILVCPNCHREIHYSKHFEYNDEGATFLIQIGIHSVKIPKNTIGYLEKLTQK